MVPIVYFLARESWVEETVEGSRRLIIAEEVEGSWLMIFAFSEAIIESI